MKSLEVSLLDILGSEMYDSWLLGKLLKNGKRSKHCIPIIENPLISEWISSKFIKYTSGTTKPITKSVMNSKRQIVKQFQDYCNFNDVRDIQMLLNESQLERNTRLSIYIDELIKLGNLEKSTIINSIQGSVMSFYSFHGKGINDYKETLKTGASDKDELILTKNDVRNIVEGLNQNNQIAVMFMYGCGLRISDVLNELVRTKQNSVKAKYQIKKFKEHYYIKNFYTWKRGVKINYVFFPTELENTLKGTYGLSDLTELDLTTIQMNRSKENPKRITDKTIRESVEKRALVLGIVQKIPGIDKAGNPKLNNATGKPEMTYSLKFGNHSFRKFYTTKTRNPDLAFPDWLYKHFEGHSSQNLDVYQQKLVDINFMYAKWLILQNELVVRQPIIDNTSKEVKALQLENNVLKDKMVNMEKSLNEKLLAIMEIVSNQELTKKDVAELFGNTTSDEIAEISHD